MGAVAGQRMLTRQLEGHSQKASRNAKETPPRARALSIYRYPLQTDAGNKMARTKQISMKAYAPSGPQAMKKAAKKEKIHAQIPVKKELVMPVKIAAPKPASSATKARAKRK